MTEVYGYGKYKVVGKKDGKEYILTVRRDEYASNPREEFDNVSKMHIWWDRLGDYIEGSPRYVLLDIIEKNNLKTSIVKDLYDGNIPGFSVKDSELESTVAVITDTTNKVPHSFSTDKGYIFDDIFYDLSVEYIMNKIGEIAVIRPIYVLEHSGITISLRDFGDKWDSGMAGFVYITKETAISELCNATEDNWREMAERCIKDEVEIYRQYIEGEVYEYTLEEHIVEHKQKICPHCKEVIEEWDEEYNEEVDCCRGYFGNCLETNGILYECGVDIVEEIEVNM